MCGVALDDKTYVLTFNTLAGAGGFAKPRSKQQSAGLLLAALDVYKRQMFSRSHLFVNGDRIASFTPHWAGYNDTQYINAVSYTHLDVYKRQS